MDERKRLVGPRGEALDCDRSDREHAEPAGIFRGRVAVTVEPAAELYDTGADLAAARRVRAERERREASTMIWAQDVRAGMRISVNGVPYAVRSVRGYGPVRRYDVHAVTDADSPAVIVLNGPDQVAQLRQAAEP
jgi:hypothetical protein